MPTIVHSLITAALETAVQRPSLYVELTGYWERTQSRTMIDAVEAYMLEVRRQYALRHPDEVATDKLHGGLFVIINRTLFTITRYQSLPDPQISQQQLIDSLSEMISSYVMQGDAGCLSRYEGRWFGRTLVRSRRVSFAPA